MKVYGWDVHVFLGFGVGFVLRTSVAGRWWLCALHGISLCLIVVLGLSR